VRTEGVVKVARAELADAALKENLQGTRRRVIDEFALRRVDRGM
jgi:hypothetical protein